jgi:CRP-like cAMP-binding protein
MRLPSSSILPTHTGTEQIFPHLTTDMVRRAMRYGRVMASSEGEALYSRGDRIVGFLIVLEGAIEILALSTEDGKPDTVSPCMGRRAPDHCHRRAGTRGQALAGRAPIQAQKFGTRLAISRMVKSLDCSSHPYRLLLEDERSVSARL